MLAKIRWRLCERGLSVPHLVAGVAPERLVVVRRNAGVETFGEDLIDMAEQVPGQQAGDTKH